MERDLLQEPYHCLVAYHLPQDHIFHNIASFKDTVVPLKTENFIDSPLPINSNLDFQDTMRFISFRFWYAYNKCQKLQERLEKCYNRVISMFSKNEEGLQTNDFKERVRLQKCLLFHLSRGLIEKDENIISQTLTDFEFAPFVEEAQDDQSLTIVEAIKTPLLRILDSAAFKEAVKSFTDILHMSLTQETLSKVIEDVKKLKIVPIFLTPNFLYGMVLPDGIALACGNITALTRPEDPNSEETIAHAGLWIALHEIGHLIIQSEALSNNLNFAKMTPPSEIQYSGKNYKDLEAGFLFNIIFLGVLDKMIWEKPDLIWKLTHLDNQDPTIPILSLEDLEGVSTIELKNITNSGVLMMRTKTYSRVRL